MKQQLRKGILAALGVLILILDSKTATEGALSGIDICLRTVIPSLFPFFVLSNILTKSLYGFPLKPLTFLSRILGIPTEASILLVSTFLGGYPVGAQCVGSYYENGILIKKDAQRLLAYCSNSGPAFIFGLVSFLFEEKWMVWAIWMIQILSTLLVASWFSCEINLKNDLPINNFNISYAVSSSMRSMGQVCAWVILFRIVISFLKKWVLWIMPACLQIMIIGLLELTNGCIELCALENVRIRFVICAALLSFGGLCIVMQTDSVTADLSLGKYLQGKLLQAIFSAFLAASVIYQRWFELFVLIGLLYYIPRIFRKKVAFSNKMMYNTLNDSGRILTCSFEKR